MVENEWWIRCTCPQDMLSYVVECDVSVRKLRLFASACVESCLVLWEEFDWHNLWFDAINLAKRFADGSATAGELADVLTEIRLRREPVAIRFDCLLDTVLEALDPVQDPAWAAQRALEATVDLESRDPLRVHEVQGWRAEAERRKCEILRELFPPPVSSQDNLLGTPRPPVTLEPAYRTGTAVSLARQIYESLDFGILPILADALQDAACDVEEVLDHCRERNGSHVRGCWVIDLLLEM